MKRSEDKLTLALNELKQAMAFRKRADSEHIIYAGIAKCFEVALEYSWKHLKRELEAAGIDAFSPKEIVKAAGKADLVDDVEGWLECINVRNIAVHDYLGITKEEYLNLIEKFMRLSKKLAK